MTIVRSNHRLLMSDDQLDYALGHDPLPASPICPAGLMHLGNETRSVGSTYAIPTREKPQIEVRVPPEL
jgi:hypothetical protein